MKKIISLIILSSLLFFKSQAQCETPEFPSDFEQLPEQLKAKYAKEFPNLIFVNELDESFDMKSIRGEVVVINYWAFSCAPCIEEMPELNKLVKKYGGSTRFISLLSPGKFNIKSESLQKKLKTFNFKYDHLATKECLYKNFEIPHIYPTHIIVGKDGSMVDVFFGADIDRLEEAIKSSL